MDPTGPTAQRFPLIARPRPPCTALPTRITTLAALADRAADTGDLTAASRVHNQAALIASDCGQPDLARSWCHRHARAWLARGRLDTTTARYALEPLVNLARLHIRAGDGASGFNLIDQLYEAITTRTDTIIDDIAVPVPTLTSAPGSHEQLCRWLWSIHLADGTRALTTAGRWHDAENHLRRCNGIGTHMLDGRQVAVITRVTQHDHKHALRLLAETTPGQPWEDAVTACLTLLCQPPDQTTPSSDLAQLADKFQHLDLDPTMVTFRTRLGLSIIDATNDIADLATRTITVGLMRAVRHSGDGYAARDILSHHGCISALNTDQRRHLNHVLAQSGLGEPIPDTLTRTLKRALAVSEAIINQPL